MDSPDLRSILIEDDGKLSAGVSNIHSLVSLICYFSNLQLLNIRRFYTDLAPQ